jgi:hypothetical protein
MIGKLIIIAVVLLVIVFGFNAFLGMVDVMWEKGEEVVNEGIDRASEKVVDKLAEKANNMIDTAIEKTEQQMMEQMNP